MACDLAAGRPTTTDPLPNCRVYWGSHGCDLSRGHIQPHVCFACLELDDMDGYVGMPPYYGPDTKFDGEDA